MDYSALYETIKSKGYLSDKECEMIQSCVNDIQELSPTEKPQVFRKSEKVINDSQNLEWCIHALKTARTRIQTEYRKIKDPEYTILVRQGRPSSEAINSEIRFKNDKIYGYEQDLEFLNNLIEFLQHLSSSLDKYLFLLRDKLKYD